MFIFELAHFLVLVFAPIGLYFSADTPYPTSLNETVPIEMHREWYRSDSDCKFYGVATLYTRTWEEISYDEEGLERHRFAATPDKIEGVVYLINKKVCPNMEPEGILRAHASITGLPSKPDRRGGRIIAEDILNLPAEEQPKWLPQVMARLDEQAVTSPAVQEVLSFTRGTMAKAAEAKAAALAEAKSAEEAKVAAAAAAAPKAVEEASVATAAAVAPVNQDASTTP